MQVAVKPVEEISAINELQSIFGDRVVTSESACKEYGSE